MSFAARFLEVVVVASGVTLIVVALAYLFGAWALFGSGVGLVAAGLAVDWEAIRNGKSSSPPRR